MKPDLSGKQIQKKREKKKGTGNIKKETKPESRSLNGSAMSQRTQRNLKPLVRSHPKEEGNSKWDETHKNKMEEDKKNEDTKGEKSLEVHEEKIQEGKKEKEENENNETGEKNEKIGEEVVEDHNKK